MKRFLAILATCLGLAASTAFAGALGVSAVYFVIGKSGARLSMIGFCSATGAVAGVTPGEWSSSTTEPGA